MTWLENIPLWLIAVAAIAFAIVPLGESHFLQKWQMLFCGTLRRPLDWLDLVMHTAPLLLLVAKIATMLRKR